MQEALLVAEQVGLIFFYILIGIVCVRKNVVTLESGTAFSKLLLYVITPCLMIKAYNRPMEKEHLLGLALAFFLAILFHILAIAVSPVLIKKRKDPKYRIERMGAIYSNCGFMAIPLIAVAVGDIGLFYAVAFISIFNVMLWTNGRMLLTEQKSISIKLAIFNPGVIGFIIGFLVYCTQVPIPDIMDQGITNLSYLNTPLAMITTGIFLAPINYKSTFTNLRIYYISAIRLVVLPLVMLLIIKMLGITHWIVGAEGVIVASLLACASPAAASITLLPAKFGLEAEYGAQIIAISTLFSIISIPLVDFITHIFLAF